MEGGSAAERALGAAKAALERTVRQLGEGSQGAAAACERLAGAYTKLERHHKAEPLLWRALRVYEQRLGASHPRCGTTLRTLLSLYHALGDVVRARPVLERLTRMRQTVGGARGAHQWA